MRVGRAVGIVAVAALAAGGCLLAGNSAGSAATPPPTPISLDQTGLGTSFCPLPINKVVAIKPGSIQFKLGVTEGGLTLSNATLSVLSEAKTNPPQTAKKYSVPSATASIPFNTVGTYDLTWNGSVLGVLGPILSFTQTAKLVISSNAQSCQVAVQVPVPSVSVPIVPSPVNSIVNGVVSSAVSAVNGVLSPVNSVVGPPLGTVGGVVGGVTGGLTGGVPGAGVPAGGSDPGTIYKPTGPTVAQRTVPQGYGSGSGSGAAGLYLPSGGGSINAPAIGFTGTGKSGSANPAKVKSGGSPHTVDLASDKPRSALDGWSALIVVVALVAMSGATAFYARTFLLQPAPATR